MKIAVLLFGVLLGLLFVSLASSENMINFNFKGIIPAGGSGSSECEECDTCEECQTCEIPRECVYVQVGSTTAGPLAEAITTALINDTTFPCVGAYRGVGSGPGYSASFAGVDVGLASRRPTAAELTTIPDQSTVRMYPFGRTSTCIVVSTNEANTVSTTWSKAQLCAQIVAEGTRANNWLGHNPQFSTHVQRLASGCGVATNAIRFDEIVDTPTVTGTIASRSTNWIGVIPPDELQPWLQNGTVQLVQVDGLTCLDATYFVGANVWFIVNNYESEIATQYLTIARETLRNLDAAQFGLAVFPDAVGVAPASA